MRSGARRVRVGLLSAWGSRLGGGVYEAMRTHALSLAGDDAFEVRVFALRDRFSDEDRAAWGAVPVQLVPQRGPASFGYAPGLLQAVLEADLDVLHLHGIWMYPSLVGASWARRTGRPYIISPHGMLEAWILARGRLKKAVARAAYEHRSWRAASLFHALTTTEERDITRAVTPAPRVLTLPNGVASAERAPARPLGPATVVYLGRIHPKKNIDALVDAWGRCARPEGSRLTIAGWGDPAHVAALESKLAAGADPSVVFVGPVFGPAKRALLGSARFLVLPSFSEGLPMTVLEAWAAGTPSLMTAACNLPEGFERGAALPTETSVAGIAAALEHALALGAEDWSRLARAAHALARTRFSAEHIAARWAETYAGLAQTHLRGGDASLPSRYAAAEA